ncbi:MAG: ureidoglycolate lyase [Eubacteriales bacterium]|nr:ureidoglycolate lyase [Eubacteriales bacterium]
MRSIKAQPLTRDAFRKYGDFCNLLLDGPGGFTPDMIETNMGRPYQGASFAICRTLPAEQMVVRAAEYHTWTGEGIIPLDGDVVIHVGKAVSPRAKCPIEDMEAFYIPKGTMVTLNPGVWHMAPFSVNCPVNNVIVLPRRTYANDCEFYFFTDEEKFAIEL